MGRGVYGKGTMAMEATATGETRRVMMAGAARATATATTKTAAQSAKGIKAQSQFGNNHS